MIEVLKEYPRHAKIWLSYGHALKTAGQRAEGIGAYRHAISLEAGLGEVWWSLANLKTYRFDAADLAHMRTQLARKDLSAEDRFHFHFALGKALEDQELYEDSFRALPRGQRPAPRAGALRTAAHPRACQALQGSVHARIPGLPLRRGRCGRRPDLRGRAARGPAQR